MQLRPYQLNGVQALRDGFSLKLLRQILHMATGSGKTKTALFMVMSAVAKGRRVIFICNRKALVNQASAVFHEAGVEHGIVQAENTRDLHHQVIIASIQSLKTRGIPDDIGLIIFDEAHFTAGSAIALEIMIKYSLVPVIGLSATPYSKGLGRYIEALKGPMFQNVVSAISIKELIEQGFLVDVDIYAPSEPDMSAYKLRKCYDGTDYSDIDAAHATDTPKLVGDIVSHWIKLAYGTPTVVFASSVAHSKHIVTEFQKSGVSAAHIDAYTDDEERKEIFTQFDDGRVLILSNVGVLCLDEETEILTSDGWLGIDDMASSHKVANWDNGDVFFEEPKEIFRRQRGADEPMYATPHKKGIRVTEGHSMVVLSGGSSNKKWKRCKVESLEGLATAVPVSGYAPPFVVPDLPEKNFDIARLVSRRAHHLRSEKGYSKEESFIEAKRRIEISSSLRALNARELSEDHCLFIGLFHADGCAVNLSSGGVEYTMSERKSLPIMVDIFQSAIDALGYDYLKKDNEFSYVWKLCRGTGGGIQERKGVFEIDHFLKRTNLSFLWSLNQCQFDTYIRGFWLGDGNHGETGSLKEGYSMRIYQAEKKVLDIIQAVASVRGYKTNLSVKNNKGFLLWSLSLKKAETASFANTHSFIKETKSKSEMVWCVKTTSGNIITRRNGTVYILGNCEGWDAPHCKTMILARPTKSLIRYVQMCGRSLRPFPGKEKALILDHSGTVSRLGFPTDDFDTELDTSDPKALGEENKEKEKKPEALPKACPECKFMKPPKIAKCPACGYVAQMTKDVEVEDGDLMLVKGKSKLSMIDKQQEYSELLGYAREKGFNPGWAYHQFHTKHGHYPANTLSKTPKPVGEKMYSWLVSQRIRKAKANARNTRQVQQTA